MKTLIVVDVQNDFLPGGALEVTMGNSIIPVINRIMSKFDLVVATQDWHPWNHQNFASNQSGKEEFEKILIDGTEQILWPDHCLQGSDGAELSLDLDTRLIEAIFRKGMVPEIDSYSAFFDRDHRKSTGLGDYLKGRKVSEVFITGLAADACVYFTAKDALELGFDTTIIEDATKAKDTELFVKSKSVS
jgi:nicotinamidase/pyrazinamidase